jgi:hypothetical protein
VFVADAIPPELRRIVEFLNAQMNPAEVLAVEVLQYVGAEGTKTLVPRVIGRTADAERAKRTGAPRVGYRWDQGAFFDALPPGSTIGPIMTRLIEWANDNGVSVEPGTSSTPGLRFRLYAFKTFYPLFNPNSGGSVWLDIAVLRRRPVTDDPRFRADLVARLDAIPIHIPPERAEGNPSIPFAALEPESALQAFLDVWTDAVAEIRRQELASG